MSTVRLTEEFKLEAVTQVTEYKRPVADVAQRLGVSTHSMYAWLKQRQAYRTTSARAE